MQVTVRFFGLFKRYTGNAQRVYDLPEGSCAGDLLRLIGEDYGPRETETLYDGNELLLLYAMAGG
jgi:molybdopterin converting factor small subunit